MLRYAMFSTLLAAALCAPVLAQDLDWTRDLARQLSRKLGQGQNLPAAPAAQGRPAASAAKKAVSYYRGLLKLRGETRDICFALSNEIIDPYEGDPDIHGGHFRYQEIPRFRENGRAGGICETSLQHTGGYIRTCSGLFLLDAPSLLGGPVFNTLARFNPETGELAVQPVGEYELQEVAGCAP